MSKVSDALKALAAKLEAEGEVVLTDIENAAALAWEIQSDAISKELPQVPGIIEAAVYRAASATGNKVEAALKAIWTNLVASGIASEEEAITDYLPAIATALKTSQNAITAAVANAVAWLRSKGVIS